MKTKKVKSVFEISCKILAIVASIFISFIIFLNVSLWVHQNILNETTSKILGIYPLIVESNSMSPLFEKDDLIFSKPINEEEVKIGDIISFENIYSSKRQIVTHRVNKIIIEDGVKKYITKGDANDFTDYYSLDGKCILGKYQSKIPKLGALIKLIRQPMTLILLVIIIILIYLLIHFATKVKNQNMQKVNNQNIQIVNNQNIQKNKITQ